MKKAIVILLLINLLPVQAFAQADVVARVKATLVAHNVPISGACGALRINNAVAWELRPAYGLLHKAGGFRAILKADGSCLDGEQSSDPEGFATDYLIRGRDGVGFDILGDGGGANNPQWAGPEDGPDMVARNFANYREPFDPAPYMGGGPVATVPGTLPGPLTSAPSTFQTPDLSGIVAQLQLLNLKVDALTVNSVDAHETINRNVTEGRAENRTFFEAVRTQWKAIVGKALLYGAPIIGALFAGRATK